VKSIDIYSKYQTHSKLFKTIFTVFILAAVYYHWSETFRNKSFSAGDLVQALNSNWQMMVLLLVLSPINTLFESFKWQMLNQSLNLSISRSIKSIYVGNAAGLLTPMRAGEYFGRLIFVPKDRISNAIASNLYCSLAQNTINTIFGTICLFWMSTDLLPELIVFKSGFLWVSGIMLIVFLILFYNAPYIIARLKMYFPYINRYIATPEIPHDGLLSKILFWSLMRYGIYFSQYILAIYALGIEPSFQHACMAVGVIFLLQTAFVLPPALSMVARIELAVLVWQGIGVSTYLIPLAALLLWIVNVATPAIIGSLIFYLSNNLSYRI
jgi:hypothetical protein